MLKWSVLNFHSMVRSKVSLWLWNAKSVFFSMFGLYQNSLPSLCPPARLTASSVEHVSVKTGSYTALHCPAQVLPRACECDQRKIVHIIFKYVLILSLSQLGLGLTCVLNAAWDTCSVCAFEVVLCLFCNSRRMCKHITTFWMGVCSC